MSIETSNFVVIRDNSPFRCQGNELFSTLDQRDALLVSRNDVIHKVKFPFNLDIIASVENKSVNLNYEQYAFVRNRDNGQTLAETSPPFAPAQQELRVYEHLFDGDENTTFKSYTNNYIRHDLVVQFPEPIDVYESIKIKAGFHTYARDGEMLINGEVVRELSAWDGDPQVFSADFTGQVSEFSIRQKNGASQGAAYTAVLNYIEIDGEKLKSIVPSSTELTLSSEADMSKYKVNMRIKKYQGSVTGVIGAVDETNKKITLTSPASFSPYDVIIIDQIDGNPVEVPEILDTDLFAATDTDDVTYKIKGAQFRALFDPNFTIKQVSPESDMDGDDLFCPVYNSDDDFYNVWVGNANYIFIKTLEERNLLDYVGNYSSVEILFYKADTNYFLYHGKVTTISTTPYAAKNIAKLHLDKIFADEQQWPLQNDVKVKIIGLFPETS